MLYNEDGAKQQVWILADSQTSSLFYSKNPLMFVQRQDSKSEYMLHTSSM